MKEKSRMKSISMLLGLLATLAVANQLYAAKPPPANPIDINQASVEQLMELPGIGQSKAEAIVAYRAQNKFTSKEDLLNIKGIGEKLLAKLSEHVTISGSAVVPKTGMTGKVTR